MNTINGTLIFLGIGWLFPLSPGDAGELRPGLVGIYRNLEGGGNVSEKSWAQLDARPSFNWGASPPHPRLGEGPFEVRWQGKLILKDDETFLRWGAHLAGEMKLTLDGAVALEAQGEGPAAWRAGEKSGPVDYGEHEFVLEYRSPRRQGAPPGDPPPARIQLWWEGESFSLEPLPAWALGHEASGEPPQLSSDRAIEKGRQLAEEHGCWGCHEIAGAALIGSKPGPRLERPGRSWRRSWLLRWLENPRALKPGARMPRLFESGREGWVERWLAAEYLLAGSKRTETAPPEAPISGAAWREGQWIFLRTGCAACHLLPEAEDQPSDPRRTSLRHLAARTGVKGIASIIANPLERYADGRMPRFPLSESQALEVAAYLWEWGEKPAAEAPAAEAAPAREELLRAVRRLGLPVEQVDNESGALPGELLAAAGEALVRRKRCGACHDGLPEGEKIALPPAVLASAKGCLSQETLPRFDLTLEEKERLALFLNAAREGWGSSPFHLRQAALARQGCWRCHPRDGEERPPLEAIARRETPTQFYARIPYLRVPSLAGAGVRFKRSFLLAAISEGVSGARPEWYSFRMPAYGRLAEEAVRALLEGDGEPVEEDEKADREQVPAGASGADAKSPLAAHGPFLAGYQGYSCISCHLWKGRAEFQVEPGSVGPELTSISKRVRKEWFLRWLENPQRFLPGTPMPVFFPRGAAEAAADVLGRSPELQKEALWQYLLLGERAEAPPLRPPAPLAAPAPGGGPRVATIPVRIPGQEPLEALAIQFPGGDLLLYDVERLTLHSWREEAELLRDDRSYRTWEASGETLVPLFTSPMALGFGEPRPLQPVLNRDCLGSPHRFRGFEVSPQGVRIRTELDVEPGRKVQVSEELSLQGEGMERALRRRMRLDGLRPEEKVHFFDRTPPALAAAESWGDLLSSGQRLERAVRDGAITTTLRAGPEGALDFTAVYPRKSLAAPRSAGKKAAGTEKEAEAGGSPAETASVLLLESALPGYGAWKYEQPPGPPIMPCALSARPKDGKLFIASMKMGEIFRLDELGDGKVRYRPVAGPFQEAYGLVYAGADLYVLHRRNLSRISGGGDDGGRTLRVERVATWPQGLVASYDWGYGLVREADGSFLFGLAPWANGKQKGAGGVLRLRPGGPLEEVAFGLRNSVGWCAGGDGGELFVTDNQGEWVAANRLCHIAAGRFYGFPNPEQPEHQKREPGKTAVWVPYGWARSLNGVACDSSAGQFGPFAGQFFLAELMAGGALIRAQVEKVNGEWQGACFRFWGEGLLGPLALAFDAHGRLYVGSITEPGWMGQPDRGGLFRIDYTGPPPFEIQEVHARRSGFELVFTLPVEAESALSSASYQVHHYRYAYGPEYGSPELDRTGVKVVKVALSADRRRAELLLPGLVEGRIYTIRAGGVRGEGKQPVVHPEAVYTLNAIPRGK